MQREAFLSIKPFNLLVIYQPVDLGPAVASLGRVDLSHHRPEPWAVCAMTLVLARVPIQCH
jgi:hypothetical protein